MKNRANQMPLALLAMSCLSCSTQGLINEYYGTVSNKTPFITEVLYTDETKWKSKLTLVPGESNVGIRAISHAERGRIRLYFRLIDGSGRTRDPIPGRIPGAFLGQDSIYILSGGSRDILISEYWFFTKEELETLGRISIEGY